MKRTVVKIQRGDPFLEPTSGSAQEPKLYGLAAWQEVKRERDSLRAINAKLRNTLQAIAGLLACYVRPSNDANGRLIIDAIEIAKAASSTDTTYAGEVKMFVKFDQSNTDDR